MDNHSSANNLPYKLVISFTYEASRIYMYKFLSPLYSFQKQAWTKDLTDGESTIGMAHGCPSTKEVL